MKIIKNLFGKSKRLILTSVVVAGLTLGAFAQDPPPPPGDGNTPDAGNQVGGAAHVGGGVLILLSLAIAYGGRRVYELKKTQKANNTVS